MTAALGEQSRQYLDALKKRVGKAPFTSRVSLHPGNNPCPFHGGDAGFSFYEREGMWFGSCKSECNKTWDAIQFVMEKDGVDFRTAVSRLGGRMGNTPESGPQTEKPKPKAMTDAEWQTWGREVTAEDIAAFASSRKDKTAGWETFRAMGCRVKNGLLGFPYRLRLENGDTKYFLVKTRALTSKDILQHNCVNSKSLFNIDTVNCFEPVYVVEGEPDVAIMEEAGFRAVSVLNATHDKFQQAQLDILCEATHIFLIPDQKQRGLDDPGTFCMDALATKLPPGKVSRINFREAKDACALAAIYGDGFAQRMEELAEDAKVPWVSKNVGNVTRLLNLGDPLWVVDRMLLYKGVTIFCSPQGGQKTTVALAMSKAISNPATSDFKFLGRDILPHTRREIGDGFFVGGTGANGIPVLYIDRENPPVVIGSRLRKMGLCFTNDILYWGDGDATDTPDVTDPRLQEWMKQTGGLIVFDSLQDWYGDAKEIDNSAMVRLMHGFRRLARLGSGVVVLHHVAKNKNGGETLADMKTFYRGGTGIVSIPDMAIGLVKDDETGLLTLGEIRFRQCPEWQITAKLDWEAGDDGKWISLSVMEDLDWKELRARRTGRQEEKKAEKTAEQEADAVKLEAEVVKDAKVSIRQLEKLTNIGRNRVEKLLALRRWNRDSGEWKQSDELPFGS